MAPTTVCSLVNFSMTNFGIQVSRSGYNAQDLDPNSPTDLQNISLTTASTSFSLLKVLAKGKVTLTNGSTTTIAHGLSYTPIMWTFLNNSGVMRKVDHDTAKTKAHIDGTNLTIRNNEGSTKDFYYYIFYDSL